MARKRAQTSHWLNQRLWKLTIAQWPSLSLCLIGIVVIFCLFFIRRNPVEYRLEPTFSISWPEFFGSALALRTPGPESGNKVDLLQSGDECFPAMLEAIRWAKKTVNFA